MNSVLTVESVPDVARSLAVEFDDQPQNDAWDDFVESLPDGHHEQTSRWGQVRAQNGWGVSRVIVRARGEIVAGVQMQSRPVRRLGQMAYVTYGPCLRAADPMLARPVIDGLKQHARLRGIAFMVVGLPYEGQSLVSDFLAAGFQRKPTPLHPHFMEATAVINLVQTPEQILASMRRRTRRNVRESLKRGIRVAPQAGDRVADFHRLMLAICQRRNITPNPARLEFLAELWRQFQPKGWIRMFFASHDSEPVSAALAFTFGSWCRVWKVGWSGQHGNLKPNEALWWQMILWARQNGFRHFDFVEVDPDEARRLAGGDMEGEGIETVTSFKLGFGGKVQPLPGAYYYVFNPVLRKVFHHGVGRWLDSPWFLRAASPFLRKLARP